MKKLIVANRKGGVLKTTVSVLIAQYAAKIGLRVLFVDGDMQGNSSSRFIDGYTGEPPTHPMESELLEMGASTLKPCAADLFDPDEGVLLVPYHASERGYVADTKKTGGIFVLPNSEQKWHVATEKLSTGEWSADVAISRLEDPSIAEQFDLLIIDVPPSISVFTDALFSLVTDVLVPLDNCEDALHGLSKVIEKIDVENSERGGRGLEPVRMAGILPVRMGLYRNGELIGGDKAFFEGLQDAYGDLVYPAEACVRHSTFMRDKSWGGVVPRSILDEKNAKAKNVKLSAEAMCVETIKRLGFKEGN